MSLVEVVLARNEGEARVIQAVLGAAGIRAFVEGGHLMDEWAMAQKILGRIGSSVKVAAGDLEEARRVLEEARGNPEIPELNDLPGDRAADDPSPSNE